MEAIVSDRRVGRVAEAVREALGAVGWREVEADRVGVVIVDDAVVGGGEEARFRVRHARQVLMRDTTEPLVLAGPTRDGQPEVRAAPQRDLAARQVADRAMPIRHQEIVAGVNPVAHLLIEVRQRSSP